MATEPESTAGPTPVAVQLQILASEHANLASTRSMVWSEVFSRAAMYLTTLSAAIVALALVSQNSGLRDQFGGFALLVLPLVLFVGVATVVRLNTSNSLDAAFVIGMNRIRARYLALAPELGPVFVMGVTDDPAGVGTTMGTARRDLAFLHFISATPIVIMTINSAVLTVFVGLVVAQLKVDLPVLIGLGVIVFIVALGTQLRPAQGYVRRQQVQFMPKFPGPTA